MIRHHSALLRQMLCWLSALAVVISVVSGAVLLEKSKAYPVYTDRSAPARLSIELQELPREKRFSEWYKQLATYETPHKRLHDLGYGLMALGGGILLAGAILWLYSRRPADSRGTFFGIVWILLWLLPIVFSSSYYRVRQQRMDYPSWGDSIAIPIFSGAIACIFGCIVLGIVVRVLMLKHSLPGAIRPRRPDGFVAWARCIFIALWILLMGQSIWYRVGDGDMGTVLSSLGFLPLMFAVLWAEPKRDLAPSEALPVNQQEEAS